MALPLLVAFLRATVVFEALRNVPDESGRLPWHPPSKHLALFRIT